MRAHLLGAVCALLVLILPAVAEASSPVGHLRVAIASQSSWPDAAATAHRQRFVILNAWQTDRLAQLKAADPAVTVLMYKNLSAMNSLPRTSGMSASGVGADEATTAHPDWYLLDTSGKRFTFWNYDYLWAADIGNASYQQRWAGNVLADLKATGFDGVFVDDVNPTIKYHATPSSVAKYPTDASYSAAMGSALASIAPQLRAAGKLVVANMGSWIEYRSTISSWLQYVDGGMDEMFVKYGTTAGSGYRDPASWLKQVEEVQDASRQGKAFLAVTQSSSDDAAAARYGYATALLASTGNVAFQMGSNYGAESWFPEYDYDLGQATATATADAAGVYRRPFERGLAVVNPTATARSVDLGGSFSGSGLLHATSATLAPHSALVLTRDDAATTPPAPAPTPTPTPTPSPTPTPTPTPTPAPKPGNPHKKGSVARIAAHTATIALAPVTRLRLRVVCARSKHACRGRVAVRGVSAQGRRPLVSRRRHVRMHARRAVWLELKVRRDSARALRGVRLRIRTTGGLRAHRVRRLA